MSQNTLYPVTHVIFDVDGLLLDTERLYTEATQNITSQYGKDYPWEVKVKTMGAKAEQGAQIIIDELQLPLTVAQYLEKIHEQYELLFPTVQMLPDSVELYQICHNKVLLPLGFSLSFSEIMALMGLSSTEVGQSVCTKFNLPYTSEQYQNLVHQHHPSVFPDVKLMKGAEKLVRHLHAHKIPIAVASGGSQKNLDLKITNHKDFFSLFLHLVLASSDPDVKVGKPSPDVFLVCAQRFPDSPDPKKCLIFEDAPNGVRAGVAAGMQVVMVPDARLDKELTKGACLVLPSLEMFRPELFGLPAYDS